MKSYSSGHHRKQWFEGLKYAEEIFELIGEEPAKETLQSLVECADCFGDKNPFDEGIGDYIEYRRTVLAKLSP